MDILLTGSTAAHTSAEKNSRTITFPGLMNKALLSDRNNVTWTAPSVSMSRDYIAEFDTVIVGIAPPTSTAAHRIYGSLSVIYHAWEIGNLRLLIDAPEPRRVWAGITAIQKNPESLIKDFFSKRSEYRKTKDSKVFERLYSSIELLYSKEWPITYYPKLPWMSFSSVSCYIPRVSSENLVGLCFDRELLDSESLSSSSFNPEFWSADVPSSSWTKSQESLVSLPIRPLKNSRWEDSEEATKNLLNSIGCMVSVYRNNDPWWSPAISQALHVGVPVVSDWLLTSMLGDPWRVLPAQVEEMSHQEWSDLAKNQKETYANSLLTWEDSVDLLNRSLVDWKNNG